MIWGVMLGGALGALCRYGINLAVQMIFQNKLMFPWATFGINVLGSFVLAFLFFSNYIQLPNVWRVAIGTGFLGAFTTFSTFELETLQLVESGKPLLALLYVLGKCASRVYSCAIGAFSGFKAGLSQEKIDELYYLYLVQDERLLPSLYLLEP